MSFICSFPPVFGISFTLHWAEESDQSSKTATIEMYAPSSYNETMNGETVSSTSEKSEAYSNEHSAEYSVSVVRGNPRDFVECRLARSN